MQGIADETRADASTARDKDKPATRKVLALAGGGPAAGLHIGALKRLQDRHRLQSFHVWSLSCIGAWVGIVWQQADSGREFEQTERFFREGVFRDDRSYARFPMNSVFGPDLATNAFALLQYLCDPASYRGLVLPDQILEAMKDTLHFLRTPSRWNAADLNVWMLDSVLAVHPWSRFLTSMVYQSKINGLSRIWYPQSSFLDAIKFDRLGHAGKPLLYHNAWNLTRQRLELFTSRDVPQRSYSRICAKSLCACSALPYIESTVEMNGDDYCEGALIDTVSFRNLVEDHGEHLDVWVSRIVDTDQIRTPRNLTEALANLCMLFAAETGKNDVKLFRFHAKEKYPDIRIVEIPVSAAVNFDWSRSNLEHGIAEGEKAADAALRERHAVDKVKDNVKEELKGEAALTDDEARDLLKPSRERSREYAAVIAKLILAEQKRCTGASGSATRGDPNRPREIGELLEAILPKAPGTTEDSVEA
jgi:predicted acylesterase/phospholipase RssA